MNHPESQEQQALFTWAEYAKGLHPELGMLYHIPNGGKRDKLEAARLKLEGVKAGVPDLCLPVARGGYHGLYIELKAGKNKATPLQRRWITALEQEGYAAAVCTGWEQAAATLIDYLGIRGEELCSPSIRKGTGKSLPPSGMRRKAIAIDFDGCLCENQYPKIGAPNWPVIQRAKREQGEGAGLILWTCREGKLLEEAVKVCEEWGLTFDAVNESLPEWQRAFKNNPRKVGATEYWDDRAVRVSASNAI